MNIVDKRVEKTIKFAQIKVGNHFYLNNHLHLKLALCCENSSDGDSINCWNVESLYHDYVAADVNVVPVNTTLFVEDYS